MESFDFTDRWGSPLISAYTVPPPPSFFFILFSFGSKSHDVTRSSARGRFWWSTMYFTVLQNNGIHAWLSDPKPSDPSFAHVTTSYYVRQTRVQTWNHLPFHFDVPHQSSAMTFFNQLSPMTNDGHLPLERMCKAKASSSCNDSSVASSSDIFGLFLFVRSFSLLGGFLFCRVNLWERQNNYKWMELNLPLAMTN